MAVAYPKMRSQEVFREPLPNPERSASSIGYGDSQGPEPSFSWYALCVRSRYEKLTATLLANKGYKSLLPLYKCRRRRPDRYKDVQLPLFPGYLFCQFNPAARLPILTTPGVIHIVGSGRTPIPIEESELDAVRRVAASRLQAEPWRYLEVGQRVYIQDGPLEGVVGILLTIKNTHRIVLSVSLLRRAVAVEVDRDWVKPALESHSERVPRASLV